MSNNVSDKLEKMAMQAKNWTVYTQLNEALDTTAGDVFCHKS